ncbi:hypothetical protein CJJ09_005634 [Candidozyma auris]|nr:hypothetical protein CJJ09_005634 [[Candida] auris]
MKTKRQDLDNELSEREYKIVTEVLSAINDTNLAPTVLKFFVTQPTLRQVAIDVIAWVLRNAKINLTTLLKALVDSGLLNRVLTDALSDCQVYVSVIGIAEDVVKALLNKIFSKRELLGLDERDILTDEQTIELLKKDGLMQPSMLEDKRALDIDVNNIVNNLLESLANSGLASSVVIAVLTDKAFINFGADLIRSSSTAHLSLSDLVTLSRASPSSVFFQTCSSSSSTRTPWLSWVRMCSRRFSASVTAPRTGRQRYHHPHCVDLQPCYNHPITTAPSATTPLAESDVGTVYTTINKASTTQSVAGQSFDPCATAYERESSRSFG